MKKKNENKNKRVPAALTEMADLRVYCPERSGYFFYQYVVVPPDFYCYRNC